jgi:hypothetical protein
MAIYAAEKATKALWKCNNLTVVLSAADFGMKLMPDTRGFMWGASR